MQGAEVRMSHQQQVDPMMVLWDSLDYSRTRMASPWPDSLEEGAGRLDRWQCVQVRPHT